MGVRVPSTGQKPWVYLAVPEGADGGAYAGFALAHLEAGEDLDLPWSGLETVVVPLRGCVAVSAGGTTIELTGREDVWESATDVAYLPPANRPCTVRAACTAADVAFGLAPASSGTAEAGPLRVPASAVVTEDRGEAVTLRHVRHLYEADRPAQRLLVVEVVTPPGHWSSFPPHRHDEPPLEEFYYCELRPRSRLGYLHVFDDAAADGRPSRSGDADEAVAVRHGDLVLVRHGYHTAASPPGGALYYLNVMAGADRAWSPTFHPAYRDLVVGWDKAPVTRRAEPAPTRG